MLLVAFLGLSLALVPLARGSFRSLADLRFRGLWLLAVAAAAQLALMLLPGAASPLRSAAHLASYPFGLAFLFVNRRVPGLWLVALGAFMNFLVIAANGGVMPAAPHALALAGLPAHPGLFSNSALLANPRLLFLGDVFAIPRSWPLSNVFSAGDLCIALGAAVTIHRAAGSRLTPPVTG